MLAAVVAWGILPTMSLSRVARPGIETNTGVHFGMTHDGTSIRVLVIREVLQTIAGGSADKTSLMATFEVYRREFEAIASGKFDRGEKGPIRITKADILKFAAEKQALPKEPAV